MLELLTQIFSFIASAGGVAGLAQAEAEAVAGEVAVAVRRAADQVACPHSWACLSIVMFPVGAIVGLVNGVFAWISYRREDSKIAEYGKTAAIITGVIITIIGGIVGTNPLRRYEGSRAAKL